MDDIIDQLTSLVQGVIQDIDTIDDAEFDQILLFMQEVIGQLQGQQGGQQRPVEPQLPLGADLLWQLAGGQPEVFVSYLRTVPDPHLNAVARNGELLKQTISQLQKQFPQHEPQIEEGIEQAPLQSSTIWGFHYSPQTKQLLVKFQGDGIYAYSGVPPMIFRLFQQGAIPAKTTGQNAYGKWWRGKNPSLGSSMHELIKLGGYPYQKVA